MAIAELLVFEISSLFLMMALGFLLVKLRIVTSGDSRILSMIMIYLVQPCVILKAFQIEFTPEVRSGFLLAVGVSIALNFVLLIISRLYAKALKLSAVEQVSIMYGNAGNLVIPLVTAVLGEDWIIYSSAFLCVQLVFLWTHCQSLLSGTRGIHVKKIVTNVNIIAIAVGLVLLITGLRLPALVNKAVNQLSNAMSAVTMVMIGMLLANVNWREVLTHRRTYLVMALKMVVTPLLILLLLKLSGVTRLIPDGKMITYVSYMAVITPSAATVTQLAQLNRTQPEYASAINVMTTLVCIVTMPLMTWLYMAVM